jgi:NADH-quinone oxidoreductase subunit A
MLLLTASDTPIDFLPIAIQLIVAAGFVITTMVLTHVLGPKLKSKKKEIAFESGIKSVGDARQPFAIKYFLTAILFVLFDVEVIFIYPWAVNYRELGTAGLVSMALFLLLFFAGFYYIIKKKALEWE